VTRTTRPYRWRAQNILTMRQLEGTAATLSRAKAAAERARGKLGSETDLIVAEVFGPAGAVYRYDALPKLKLTKAPIARGYSNSLCAKKNANTTTIRLAIPASPVPYGLTM
jgi:hypothetical protein